MNIAQQKYADEYQKPFQGEPAGLIQGAAMGECARQSAKNVIRDRARQLRNEADRLEALARALPEELPSLADQALFDMIFAARR